MPKKIVLDHSEITRLYTVERIPATQISEMFNVSSDTIYKHLDEVGIKRRNRRDVCGVAKPIDIEELKHLYEAGSTAQKLSQKFGYSSTLIFNRLRNAGIKTRSLGETRKTRPPTGAELRHLAEARKKNLGGWKHTAKAKAAVSQARRAKVDDLEIIRLINEDGISEHKIAAKFGISVSAVCRHAKSTGIPYTPKWPRGENAHNWRGGISFEPYCPKFNHAIKEKIRNEFNRQCYLCGAEENGVKLCVHHVDYDKNDICNGKIWPFVPLCRKCHSRTNHNRWYWFNLLMNYWLDKYIDDFTF